MKVLKLSDTKIGDDVTCYVCVFQSKLAVSATASAMIFSAAKVIAITKNILTNILTHGNSNDYLLAWKASNGDKPQIGVWTPTLQSLNSWPTLGGYSVAGWYLPSVEVFRINGLSALEMGGVGSSSISTQESPCITCSRKNFISDKTCWWCGKNPWK